MIAEPTIDPGQVTFRYFKKPRHYLPVCAFIAKDMKNGKPTLKRSMAAPEGSAKRAYVCAMYTGSLRTHTDTHWCCQEASRSHGPEGSAKRAYVCAIYTGPLRTHTDTHWCHQEASRSQEGDFAVTLPSTQVHCPPTKTTHRLAYKPTVRILMLAPRRCPCPMGRPFFRTAAKLLCWVNTTLWNTSWTTKGFRDRKLGILNATSSSTHRYRTRATRKSVRLGTATETGARVRV